MPGQVRITRKTLHALVHDPELSAATADLVYVRDSDPGISRVRRGKGFSYLMDGKAVSDKALLSRIRALVIPPAWENVWICREANGHLQATGTDTRNRKQYKYHPRWSAIRSQTKFHHLHAFGLALPAIRARLEADISQPGLPPSKVLAAVVLVLQNTGIRIGNGIYEKLYGSFGVTTLRDRHVEINGSSVLFSFRGKKGVYQEVSLRDRRLARIIRQCRDIPGKELFQYYDEEKKRRPVDSGMVNEYIREISGGNFTAKDFRTWTGTLHALRAFRTLGGCDTEAEARRRIIAALDVVAKAVGNTRAVCRKYYVHPLILTLYQSRSLDKYLERLQALCCGDMLTDRDVEEQVLIDILDTQGPKTLAAEILSAAS